MATTCSSPSAKDETSNAARIFKTLRRALGAVLFGSDLVYDASVVPELASSEYPEVDANDPSFCKNDSIELEKCLIYLSFVLEKVKALNSENKILKRRVQILLRKCGKLKTRSTVDSNNNKRSHNTLINNYQKSEMKIDNNGNVRIADTLNNASQGDNICKLAKRDAGTFCEVLKKDEGTHYDVPKHDKVTHYDVPKHDKGTGCEIFMRDEETQNTDVERADAQTQCEDQLNAKLEFETKKKPRRRRWSSGIPIRCKVAPMPDSDNSFNISPTKIPVPTFKTQSRSDVSPASLRCRKNLSSSFTVCESRRQIAPPPAKHHLESTTEKLMHIPSLLGRLMVKTSENIERDSDVSWPSVFSSESMEEQYAKIFGNQNNIWDHAVSLNGIQYCIEGITRHISGLIDKDGNTLLHLIARNDKPGMLPRLLEYSRNVINKKNADSETALIVAAKVGSVRVARLLLRAGASPNLQDNNGRTALMHAVRADNSQVVRLLVMQPGISLFVADKNGLTAVDLAIRSDSIDIQCCFLMHSQLCE